MQEPEHTCGHGSHYEGGQGDGHRDLHRDLHQGVPGLGGVVLLGVLLVCLLRHADGVGAEGVPGDGDDVQGATHRDLLHAALLVLGALVLAICLRIYAAPNVTRSPGTGGRAEPHPALQPHLALAQELLAYLQQKTLLARQAWLARLARLSWLARLARLAWLAWLARLARLARLAWLARWQLCMP